MAVPPHDPVKTAAHKAAPAARQAIKPQWPYSVEVFEFVQHGVAYTVQALHGRLRPQSKKHRHVGGRELCLGLRQFATKRWGFMARTVLKRWNVNSTLDFGRIVFLMAKVGLLKTSDADRLEDFRDVYDFATLESEYRII